MSLREFEIALDTFREEDIPQDLGTIARAVSLQALSGITLKTPVDTGRARGNWITTADSIDLNWSENLDPSGGGAISAGAAVISAALSANPFRVITIQNNLPYIEDLEDGHSRQAPQGMLSTTIAEIESQFS